MINDLKLSLCTRFKDRLLHITQTLPTWVRIPEIDEIVITDYNSQKDNIISLLKKINDKRVTLLKVPGVMGFDRGRCHNIGIGHAQGNLILNIDADILLSPSILRTIRPDNSLNFYVSSIDNRKKGYYGSCIFFKEMWKKVNGYVEGFNTWGCEDINFYARLKHAGYKQVPIITPDMMNHISHDDKLRFQHHEFKRKDPSKIHAVLHSYSTVMQPTNYSEISYPYDEPLNDWPDNFRRFPEIGKIPL